MSTAAGIEEVDACIFMILTTLLLLVSRFRSELPGAGCFPSSTTIIVAATGLLYALARLFWMKLGGFPAFGGGGIDVLVAAMSEADRSTGAGSGGSDCRSVAETAPRCSALLESLLISERKRKHCRKNTKFARNGKRHNKCELHNGM